MLNFKKIEEEYCNIKQSFQTQDNFELARAIVREVNKPILLDVFNFLLENFQGKYRKDKKTPLVFHSIYLTKLLHQCMEEDIDSFLTASLHDILEDTGVTEIELKNQKFMQNRDYLMDYLRLLKEDISLSREPNGKTLPPRYREHIKRLIDSPKQVVNVEILDRFSDLMDLDYILSLPNNKREMRLSSKLIKTKSFVKNITNNRKDFNSNCLELFNYKVDEIEKKYNICANTEILFP